MEGLGSTHHITTGAAVFRVGEEIAARLLILADGIGEFPDSGKEFVDGVIAQQTGAKNRQELQFRRDQEIPGVDGRHAILEKGSQSDGRYGSVDKVVADRFFYFSDEVIGEKFAFPAGSCEFVRQVFAEKVGECLEEFVQLPALQFAVCCTRLIHVHRE